MYENNEVLRGAHSDALKAELQRRDNLSIKGPIMFREAAREAARTLRNLPAKQIPGGLLVIAGGALMGFGAICMYGWANGRRAIQNVAQALQRGCNATKL